MYVCICIYIYIYIYNFDCLLTLTTAHVRIPSGACENVTIDLVLGGGFAGYSGFLYHLQQANHANMAEK